MEEFFAKYGVKTEHQFFTHVASEPIFAMRVAGDFFYEKFPQAPIEEVVPVRNSGEVETPVEVPAEETHEE
jgi:hypothetical protein